ncbi:MAG: S9 family peptidase [Pseudomonadota bacterium]
MIIQDVYRAGFIAAVALMGLWVSGTFSPAAAQSDAKSFGALPYISEAVISPNGKRVAMLESRGPQTVIGIYTVGGESEAPSYISVGENKGRDLIWANDDYVLVLVSATTRINTVDGLKTYEYFRYFSLNANTQEAKIMFATNPGFARILSSGQLLHRLPDDPQNVLIAQLEPNSGLEQGSAGPSRLGGRELGGYSIYKVNLKTGRAKAFARGKPGTDDWVVGADGAPVLRIDLDDRTKERIVLDAGTRRGKELRRYKETPGQGVAFNIYGLSVDGTHAIVSAVRKQGVRGLYKMDISTGEIGEAVYLDETYDVSTVKYDFDTGSIIGTSITKEFPSEYYFDDAFSGISSRLKKALKADVVTITSYDTARERWIVQADYSNKPTGFFLYDTARKELSAIGSSYPWLENLTLARTEFDYAAPDGTTIHGYLTKPSAQAAENLPLIVLAHGGPANRDTQAFDWWASFYAANGYAVYQPNFRGSSGYGYDFRTAGRRQWGRLMQDDITNGVRALIKEGAVDPARICIAGASYGGYAALAGATLTPDLYACSISVNGVTDLMAVLGEGARSSEYSLAYWQTQIGDRFKDESAIKAVSPVEQADKVRVPILLIHGKDDTVVPYSQSKRMEGALERAGKTVKLITLNGEDHWLSGAETRQRMLSETLDFVNASIGDR